MSKFRHNLRNNSIFGRASLFGDIFDPNTKVMHIAFVYTSFIFVFLTPFADCSKVRRAGLAGRPRRRPRRVRAGRHGALRPAGRGARGRRGGKPRWRTASSMHLVGVASGKVAER